MTAEKQSDDVLAAAVRAAHSIDLDRVPAGSLKRAGLIVADTLGVINAGARSAEMIKLTEARAGGGSASVLGPSPTTAPPETAAFLNATAGTFIELDEGMRPTGHPAMHVVPAALAVAEQQGASGADLLRAVIVGYEVTSRLFTAFRLTYPVHPHGHFGAVGAAVAVAELLGSEPVEAARIAATTPLLPVWQPCYEGATVRNTYTGWANEIGVRSAALAAAGFTGSAQALEASYGQVAGTLIDPDALTAPLDHDQLGIRRNYFKRHSACALSHAALDAVLSEPLPPVDQIEEVRVETVRNNLKLDRLAHPNSLSGRFSLPYAVATAIVLGRTDVGAFAAFRPEVATWSERVTVEAAEDLEECWPDAAPARVTVVTREETITRRVDNPHGHHSDPLTAEEVREKFEALAEVPSDAGWWQRLTNLVEVADCRTLFGGHSAGKSA